MITLTINGQEAQVEKGLTILEAARELGISIPTLCYNEALLPYSGCRLCLVETLKNGKSKLVTSCSSLVEEGLVIQTDSERVLKTRKWTLELLLSRCPKVEKIQELAAEMDIKEPKFKIKHEDERCILCGLCVRMCEERMGVGTISFVNRGPKREVTSPFKEYSEVCMGCGACSFVCPTGAIKPEEFCMDELRPIPSDFDQGMGQRPAAYILYPQTIPHKAVIDSRYCVHILRDKCEICKEFCGPEAIDFDQKEQSEVINVGALILAPGFELYDAHLWGEYGFGVYSNVITHLQLERMLSAAGPSKGDVYRPSDHKFPNKIAFIQCVGSRDQSRGNEYCSAICCMSSMKEAIIVKEHNPDVDITIFYLDIRTFGKGFERYFQNSKKEHGIKYERCMISKVVELQQSKNLRIRYAKDHSTEEDEFDLVVLACGLNTSEKTRTLADKIGIQLNEYGFCKTDEFFATTTTRPGIFTAGVFNEPKDIPETVVEASSAAAEASRLLSSGRGTLVKKKKYPEERDIQGEPLRVGVFICRCGRNIGSVVDVPAVVASAKALQDVVFADENLYTCSQDSLEYIKKMVEEHNLNRVVVASCTPVTHAPIFRDTIRDSGLNPYLFELVSIREHCAWVHMNDRAGATEKAKQLVAMSVAKVRSLRPIKLNLFDIDRRTLVIGGGFSGMTAAINLAEQNFETYLIEKSDDLGGNLKNLYATLQGRDPQELLKNMINRLEDNEKLHVYTNAHIKETLGYLGNYKTKVYLEKEEKFLELEHGAIIVATGAQEYKPTEYLYGQDDRIITQQELEEKLTNNQLPITNYQSVVMIQCVGSRDDDHPYCSRVCCSHAIKNALKIKKMFPKTNVYILYRDVRTYGFLEKYYHDAREEGVMFVRYDEKQKPEVTNVKGQLQISLPDLVLGEDIILNPDLVVLSAGIVPNNEELARTLKLPLTSDGFFLEAHAKIRPIDFSAEGVFICGLAHSPRSIRESITQAQAAAIKVVELLSKEKLEAKAEIPEVKEKWCSGCGLCVEVCQYNARELDEKKRISRVLEAICQGCGACAAVCPNGATQQREFESEAILSVIDVVAGD